MNKTNLAKKLGVSRQAVTSWYKGERMPSRISLKKLAEHYDASFDDVYKHFKQKETVCNS